MILISKNILVRIKVSALTISLGKFCMITFWYPWHFLTAEILQCFWNRSCCASFLQQLGSKAAVRCAAGGLHLPKLLGTTAAHCILLLHHRGVSALDSDMGLGSRDGFQTACLSWTLWIGSNLWHYWRFWDSSSEDQKGLHWECGCGRVVDIRTFCLRTRCPCGSRLGSSHRWQQGHGGLQRLKSCLRLPETLEAPEVSGENSLTLGESCDLMRCTVWGLEASYVSSFIFFFFSFSQIKQCKWKE